MYGKITEEDEPSNQSIEVKDIKAWPWVADMTASQCGVP